MTFGTDGRRMMEMEMGEDLDYVGYRWDPTGKIDNGNGDVGL